MPTEPAAPAEPAFGALLRRYRLAAGLSQEASAERARMSTVGVGALERGDRCKPYRETVASLAKALDLSAREMGEFEGAAGRQRPAHVRAAASQRRAERTANLPAQRVNLVGRENDVAKIAAISREARLVTITGPGGIGKTQTAIAVAHRLVNDRRSRAWFVELAAGTTAEFVAMALAHALGAQASPNRKFTDTLAARLRGRAPLLVLDNCEHVIAAVAKSTDELLRACPGLRILATSREPLHIAGERIYRLPPLPVPPGDGPEAAPNAADYAAVGLFVERAREYDHRFALDSANARIIGEVCRRLDGIPLAIELAAARLQTIPLEALAARLDQRFRILTGGERTALPRHQTMRALIDWSYNLLSADEQLLFERLSVFSTGCTLLMAASAGGDASDELAVLDTLTSLVDKSLVVADCAGGDVRYRMLESTRHYAHEKYVTRGGPLAHARDA